MTIQGAMKELVNLLNADDIPVYYKGGIKKVIETIDDYIDGKDDYVKRKTEPQTDRWSHKCIGCANNDTCEFAFTDAVKICRYINEPQTERSGVLFRGELEEGNYRLIKTTDGWVLQGEDIVFCGWERRE